jgi:hypothetical protein
VCLNPEKIWSKEWSVSKHPVNKNTDHYKDTDHDYTDNTCWHYTTVAFAVLRFSTPTKRRFKCFGNAMQWRDCLAGGDNFLKKEIVLFRRLPRTYDDVSCRPHRL